jgi:hypothetical protein
LSTIWEAPGATSAIGPTPGPAAYTFANAGRNSVDGTPLQSSDLAILRTFQIRDRTSFQFRSERNVF